MGVLGLIVGIRIYGILDLLEEFWAVWGCWMWGCWKEGGAVAAPLFV
jgi:hypothetical protein